MFLELRDAVPGGGGAGPRFLFCPTQYCGMMAEPSIEASPYLVALGAGLFHEVDVFWTGPSIVSRSVTVEHVRAVAAVSCATAALRPGSGAVARRVPLFTLLLAAPRVGAAAAAVPVGQPARERLRRWAPGVHWAVRRPGRWCAPPPLRTVHCRTRDSRAGSPPHVGIGAHIAGVVSNPNCEYEANYCPLATLGAWAAAARRGEAYAPRDAMAAALAAWLPRFHITVGSLGCGWTPRDLGLLSDMFYLPFDVRARAGRVPRDVCV